MAARVWGCARHGADVFTRQQDQTPGPVAVVSCSPWRRAVGSRASGRFPISSTPEESGLAARRTHRGKDHSRSCRAGLWRHAPILPVCARCGRAWRAGDLRGAAEAGALGAVAALPRILNITVPQVGHLPLMALRPFFMVSSTPSAIGFLALHLTQYPSDI